MSDAVDLNGFYRALHARNLSVADLAAAIGSERSHVARVLRRYPNRGGHTRRKLAALLTSAELDCLGWDAEGRIVRGEAPSAWLAGANASLVLRGTFPVTPAGGVSRGTSEVVA